MSFVALLLLLSRRPAADAQSPMLGFAPARAAQQKALESKFDAFLNKSNLREWMKRMTARPHHVGSPYGRVNAEFIAAQFRSWGFETEIEEFQVLFPSPKNRLLEMTAPRRFRARLEEPALKEDATSGVRKDQLPVYNAYSIDGDVSGPLVYVNYGVPKDYEVLEERGIDVKGKIVIARYGSSWGGIKPKVAAEHGAVGCIIYSDPRDDGYFQGDVYPKGSYRNEYGAQRGSVADMPQYSGDPLTPGVGATKDAKRLPIKDAPTLTKIPVLPISYADAIPLLKELGGPVAPEDWRGALPLTYHLGPGPATVHMKLEFDWKIVPCYDVIAKMTGSELPDEWVIRGNHHDAWVFGAQDPISGTVAVMEEARAVGELAKTGWKPKRTIVFAAWDGEEPGLLGSTEWVETHAEMLREKAVLYLNSDTNGRGFLRAGGSHTLERFVEEISQEVFDPEIPIPVLDRMKANRLLHGTPEQKKEAKEPGLRLEALGSGSDYTPFLQHIGVASLDIRYGLTMAGGSYHSVYDSFDHYSRFMDPNFDYGIALCRTAGRAILRCATADVLPVDYVRFADTIGRYANEVMKLADDMREETAERNRQIAAGVFAAASDPILHYPKPAPRAAVPVIDFSHLRKAVSALTFSSRRLQETLNFVPERKMSAADTARLDHALMEIDRAMIRTEGLPRRPWYKHMIYAPGFYTGYGVKTLPGLREAIEERKWEEAREQVGVVAATLERIAAAMDVAMEMLVSSR